MAKTQSFIPVYDTATKRILGVYVLEYAKDFDGDEEETNILFPATDGVTNMVTLQKITPNNPPVTQGVTHNDWYMAAVFTRQQVLDRAYRGYPNFADIVDVAPSNVWSSAAASPNQLRTIKGVIVQGLDLSFKGVAALESTYVAPL